MRVVLYFSLIGDFSERRNENTKQGNRMANMNYPVQCTVYSVQCTVYSVQYSFSTKILPRTCIRANWTSKPFLGHSTPLALIHSRP